eukprot:COSAG01_NODE_1175_length_11334_cov_23.401152_6_plen_561_part_00
MAPAPSHPTPPPPPPWGGAASDIKMSVAMAQQVQAPKRRECAEGLATSLFVDAAAFMQAADLLARCGLITLHRRRRTTIPATGAPGGTAGAAATDGHHHAESASTPPQLRMARAVQLALARHTLACRAGADDGAADAIGRRHHHSANDDDSGGGGGCSVAELQAVAELRCTLAAAKHAALARLWGVVLHRFVQEASREATLARTFGGGGGGEEEEGGPCFQMCRPLLGVASGLAGAPVALTKLTAPLRAALAGARGRVIEMDYGCPGLAEHLYRAATEEELPASEAESEGAADRHSLRVASARLELAHCLMRQHARRLSRRRDVPSTSSAAAAAGGEEAGSDAKAAVAAEHIKQAVLARRELLGVVHEDTVAAMRQHCDALRAHVPPQHEDAIAVLENLRRVTEGVLGPWHPNTAKALLDLAEGACTAAAAYSSGQRHPVADRPHADVPASVVPQPPPPAAASRRACGLSFFLPLCLSPPVCMYVRAWRSWRCRWLTGGPRGVAVYEEAGKFTQALQALDRAMDICQTTMGVVRDIVGPRPAPPRPISPLPRVHDEPADR